MLALAKTPTVDGQRHDSHFSKNGSIGRLNAGSFEQLFLAQAVHSCMPVNEENAGRGALELLGNQQESGNRFDPIQVEDKPLDSVIVVFFGAHQFGRRGFMLPGQIAEQAPEIGAPALLVCGECGFCFGDQVAGSGIQAEGDASGQKSGSRHKLAAGGGFLLRRLSWQIILYRVLGETLRAARISGVSRKHGLAVDTHRASGSTPAC